MATRGARRREVSRRLVQDERVGRGAWWRLLSALVVGSLALGGTIALLPGIAADSWWSVVLAVLVVEVVGLLLRPLLTGLLVWLSWFGVLLLGLFAQGIVMLAGLTVTPGIRIDGFGSAVLAAWVYALLASLFGWLLSVDREDAFLAHCIRQATREAPAEVGPETGVVVVQLDGVPEPVLQWALRAGNLPTLGRWIRSGSHVAGGWTVRLPSTTPVSQAGILHGRTDDIPAFRWWEKDRGRLMVANRPADAAVIEGRISDGRGLLADDGASISNLFSGDAAVSLLSMSGRRRGRGGMLGPSRSYAAFFAHPYGFSRAVMLTVGEMVKEVFQRRRQRRRGIEPRVHRGGAYVLLRGITNVLLRDLNVALVVEQLVRGTKVVYVDFVDYDEIAHHAGPTRPESLAALDGLDRVLAILERAAAVAPRPYEFVVLSDHGQSQGATFRQRCGKPLEEVVRGLMGTRPATVAATAAVEPWGPVNTLLSEVVQQRGASGRVAGRVLGDRVAGDEVSLGPARTAEEPAAPELVVCGSGNLGLVSFADRPGRLTLEDVEASWPGLVDGLATHDGIGLVLVDTAAAGPVVVGPRGTRQLASGEVTGDDPLGPYEPEAAADLARIAAYAHAPDLYLVSDVDPQTGEVAAFEELVGCHGGLGGWQTQAILVRPASWAAPSERLLGAEAVHRQLVRWLEDLGHRRSLPVTSPGSGSAAGAGEVEGGAGERTRRVGEAERGVEVVASRELHRGRAPGVDERA